MPQSRTNSTLMGLIAYLALAAFCPGYARAQVYMIQSGQGPAFAGAPAGIELTEGTTASRSRRVDLDPRLGFESGVPIGERLTLNLFSDAEYEAVVDRVNKNVNGTVTLRARLDGYPLGYMILSTTDGRSLGVVEIPERGECYKLVAAPGRSGHYVLDTDRSAELENGPPQIPPAPTSEEASEIEEVRLRVHEGSLEQSDMATIDMMIVYTPAAASWAATNGGGIDNVIALAIERAQLALDNSDTETQVNLVFSSEVSYAESGNASADLRRITASESFNPWGSYWEGYYIPGYMDDVHSWRVTYGADLVSLFSLLSGTGGTGWLLTNTGGRPDYGFSVVRVQQASWTYTCVHEMGHNMGCGHHKQQSVQPGPTVWPAWPENTWSAGWRWTGSDGGHYCSVMTYSDGQYFSDGIYHERVAHFSSPDVLHAEQPTGHATEGDNARTLRSVKHTVAEYRAPAALGSISIAASVENAPWSIEGPRLSESGIGATVFENQPHGTYTVTWHHLEGWTAPQPVQVSDVLVPGGGVTFVGDYTPALLVSDVRVSERPTPGSFDVTYDLQATPSMSVTVWLLLSTDGGVTFPDTCATVFGDVGDGVPPGAARHIVWDAAADFPRLASTACVLRVLADDHLDAAIPIDSQDGIPTKPPRP